MKCLTKQRTIVRYDLTLAVKLLGDVLFVCVSINANVPLYCVMFYVIVLCVCDWYILLIVCNCSCSLYCDNFVCAVVVGMLLLIC